MPSRPQDVVSSATIDVRRPPVEIALRDLLLSVIDRLPHRVTDGRMDGQTDIEPAWRLRVSPYDEEKDY